MYVLYSVYIIIIYLYVLRMTDFGMCGWLKQRRRRRRRQRRWQWFDGVARRGWGALVLGTNQYLTGGKRTDGKKAAWQPSAIPHRLILCCARTCFSSSSIPIRVLYYFILLHRRVSSSLFGRPALTRTPCASATTVIYKCSAPTEIFTLKK